MAPCRCQCRRAAAPVRLLVDPTGKGAAEETLEVLEWKRLSSAVSSFAHTALGRERFQYASKVLLPETYGALEFEALRGNSCDLGSIQTDVVKWD